MKKRPAIGDDISAACAHLKAGKLAAFPTETVYGLGAIAKNKKAVAKLYRTKRRPRAHPVIVHLPNANDIAQWAKNIPAAAKQLINAFMPGPLTLVLPKRKTVPPEVCGGGETVAVRVPAHPVAAALLRAVGEAIAAPSANRFGKLSATRAEDVAAEFDGSDIYILRGKSKNGIECAEGIESAVVGFYNGKPSLLRPGAISEARLIKTMGERFCPPPKNAKSPGRLPRHYAPQKPLTIIPEEQMEETAKNKSAAVLSPRRPKTVAPELWRKAETTPRQYARALYRNLRELDQTKAKTILAAAPPQTKNWQAITDRLTRAAQPPAK